jgi:hypothetical protein
MPMLFRRCSLAELYRSRGDYAVAEPLLHQALHEHLFLARSPDKGTPSPSQP